MKRAAVFFLYFLLLVNASSSSPIKHVVLLMMVGFKGLSFFSTFLSLMTAPSIVGEPCV